MTTTTTTLAEKYAPRVALGAGFLDKCETGWFTRIDKEQLNFPSMRRCVLGQLHGSYYQGLEYVYGKEGVWGLANGFTLEGKDLGEEFENWPILTDLWLTEIGNRQALAAEVSI